MQNAGKGGTGPVAPSNAPGHKRDAKDPLDEEDIPILHPGAQAMAMFVPLEQSLFEPFDAPKNEVDRLKASLENFEKHSAAVSENIAFVYERERRRILKHAKTLEAAKGFVDTELLLQPGDEEIMLAYVTAPMPADADYSNRHLSTYNPPGAPQDCPPRQAAILWPLFNTGQSLTQITGYNAYAQTVKDEYRAGIEKELGSKKEQPTKNGQEGESARS